MRRTLLTSTCALAVAVAVLAPLPGLASTAPSHGLAPWLSHATPAGDAEDTRIVHLTAFLSLRNVDALKALISAQSTPRSPQYGKFLTPDQFRAAYAPASADVERVQKGLEALGFTIEETPKSGLFVNVSGTVAQVKAAFGVSQKLFNYRGQTLRANVEEPKLPASLAGTVRYLAGLDDSALLRHSAAKHMDGQAAQQADGRAPNASPPTAGSTPSPFCSTYWGDHTATLSTAPGPYPATLPWLLCSYTPDQIRQAYGMDKVTQDGTGVKVGVVDTYASPTIVYDVNRYSKLYKLPRLTTNTNFFQIVPKGIYKVPNNDPCGPQGWYGEETLDIEAVHSTAPGATIIYAGDACTDPANSALYTLIDNHLTDIVTNSYSYGGENVPPDFINSENQYFMQAAAEGMSLMFSSGDDGDLAAENGIASGTWDATSPYVTAVGGTSLALFDATGKKTEWGWGNYRAYLADATVSGDGTSITTTGLDGPLSYYAGEGGGPSLSQLAPDYQAKVKYKLSGFTTLANGRRVPLETPHRVTPDISMVADPYTGFLIGETYTTSGNPIYDSPCTPINSTLEYCLTGIGGTSLASPLFAGVLALVDQSRFNAGKSAVGLVNAALYGMSVGKPGTTHAPIIDVQAPLAPTAVLRGYLGDLTSARVVTMNSTIAADNVTVIEGVNTSYKTTKGYDEGSGLGTPNVPALISAFDEQ